MLHNIGQIVHKNARQGGGTYVVIGHINCSRCNTVVEEREQIEPTKKQRQRGQFNVHGVWCHECGLYEGRNKERVNKNELQNVSA
jgi:hypothetical protein